MHCRTINLRTAAIFAFLVGGRGAPYGSDYDSLSSSEIFPNRCSPPSLPESRINHALFTTVGPSPRVALCGGEGIVHVIGEGETLTTLASCLVLDQDMKDWDDSRMSSLPQPRCEHAVVTLEGIGNYLIGGLPIADDGDDTFLMTSDFLAAGSQQWVTGPATPVEGVWDVRGPCSVAISEQSFLVIGGLNIREYRVDLAKPTSNEGWQKSTRWPDLQQKRAQQPGCARISGHWCL